MEDRVLFAIMLAVQIAGVTSVVIARVSEHPHVKARYQRFFFVCLAMVGVASMLAMAAGRDSWLLAGASVPLMAIAVTLDTRLGDEPAL